MDTRAQRCKRCGKTMIVPIGAQSDECPVCQTISHFGRKIKHHIVSRISQYANELSSQNHHDILYGQPFQTSATLQSVPPPAFYSDNYHYPQPQASAPLMQGANYQKTSQVHRKKRALLCGVTYNGQRQRLEASVLNVRSMQQLLVNRLGFPDASIRVLTEEESNPSRSPTKHNIQMGLQWLIQGCQSGDSLVFYYAGHGSRVPDEDGDEIDGYDEALCPVDYMDAGKIIDDEINATIVAPLPHGAILHSIIDTCCSGTLLDLPFLCRINKKGLYIWEDQHRPHSSIHKGTSGGKAICISACADHQNSADTSAFTGNAIGALTFSFIQAVQSESKLTYGHLLSSMRKKVRQAQEVVGLFAPFASSKSQEPQLSCCKRFEIYSELFMM